MDFFSYLCSWISCAHTYTHTYTWNSHLGTGFAYVGREYRLQIAEKEKFIDLLFYNLKLSCYVVVEVKIGEFDFADVGQLGGYVVMVYAGAPTCPVQAYKLTEKGREYLAELQKLEAEQNAESGTKLGVDTVGWVKRTKLKVE